MPLLVVFGVLLYNAVCGIARLFIRKIRETKPMPLCKDYIHAHVQYSTKAQVAISCVYGGTVRPLKLDVLYCTDYQSRNLSARPRMIGFVHQIASAE
jgi:hypothetical protein